MHAHTGISVYKALQLQQNLVDVWAEIFHLPASLGASLPKHFVQQFQLFWEYTTPDEAYIHCGCQMLL